MKNTIPKDRRHELSAASTTISVFLTGAFVLRQFGVNPLLDTAFVALFGVQTPLYFDLALGASGVFSIFFTLIFVWLFQPLECVFGIDPPEDLSFNIIDDIGVGDFVAFLGMYAMFVWVLIANGLGTNQIAYITGAPIMFTSSIVFRVVPRAVAMRLEYDCLWPLKIVLVGIPVAILTFVPTMAMIALVS